MKPNFASAPDGSVAKRYSDDTIAKCHNQAGRIFPMNRRIAFALLRANACIRREHKTRPAAGYNRPLTS